MKKIFLLILTSFIIISCSKSNEKGINLQKIIDVDNNGDYEYYFKSLSDIYIDFLKTENKSLDSEVIFDSIVKEKKELNNLIKDGKLNLKNHIIDSFPTSDKSTKIYKYRSHLSDIESKTELIKEKIFLLTNIKNKKKIIPYKPVNNSKFDSILNTNIHQNIINEIKNAFTYTEYNNTDFIFLETKKRFEEYTKLFKSNNLKFLDYLYPPIINKLNKNGFNNKLRKQYIEDLIKSKNSQDLNFKRFFVDKFYSVECLKEKNVYILEYLIDVENNTFIPGKLVVIMEQNMIYFIEMDLEEIKENFNDIFPDEFINCLKENLSKQ